jgi:CTP synthase (UTP-ammonia lyase)
MKTDLDLGHYERFIDENLTRESNFTRASIYQSLIAARAPRATSWAAPCR